MSLAVVIPAFFGAIFGPMPAALIADLIKQATLFKSLIAAASGNFIGFFFTV